MTAPCKPSVSLHSTKNFRILASMNKRAKDFLLASLCITIIVVFAYAITQQTLRRDANFPQTQMVKTAIVPESSVEISQSLEPFVQIYDENKNLIQGNALLHGKIPTIPKGVLEYAKTHGENRITWQPETGIRIAVVVSYQKNTYIVAGRHLREIENKIDAVGKSFFLVEIIMLLILSIFL